MQSVPNERSGTVTAPARNGEPAKTFKSQTFAAILLTNKWHLGAPTELQEERVDPGYRPCPGAPASAEAWERVGSRWPGAPCRGSRGAPRAGGQSMALKDGVFSGPPDPVPTAHSTEERVSMAVALKQKTKQRDCPRL